MDIYVWSDAGGATDRTVDTHQVPAKLRAISGSLRQLTRIVEWG